MGKIVSIEEYFKRLRDLKIEYVPNILEYRGLTKTITHSCYRGHKFKARPKDILRGKKCSLCYHWRSDV